MLISTKGRYAMRIMLDLAAQDTSEYTPLKDVAARQDISEKYLESIITALGRAGLVEGVRGKGGGYRLTRKPEEYTAFEVITAANGSIAPVACLKDPESVCEREDNCKMQPVYRRLNNVITAYLSSVTVRDIMNGDLDRGCDTEGIASELL